VLLQRFKMSLREAPDSDNSPVITTERGRQFSVVKVIADYLQTLGKLALEEIRDRTAGHLQDREILWCLTVPAIWGEREKQLMRTAFVRAGLISKSQTEADRLLIVLEPEAAAIHCQAKDQFKLPVGSRFMVVDCGGGTADIVAFEVRADGLSQVASPTGGAYGSTNVDLEFRERVLAACLGTKALNQFLDEEPADFLDMQAAWERMKCTFDPTDPAPRYFALPAKLYKILAKRHPEVLECLSEAQDGEDSALVISRDAMLDLFKKTVNGVIQRVDDTLRQMTPKGCDYMFIVGGFAGSAVLHEAIRRQFETKVKKVVVPPVPGAAVVEGAVAFGLEPSIIVSRCCRLTYGYGCVRRFQACDPDSKRFVHDESGEDYCNDVFVRIVARGDQLSVNEKRQLTTYPSYKRTKQTSIPLFSTRLPDARYTDGMAKLGVVVINTPSDKPTSERPIELVFYFGMTEMRVIAKDVLSGQIASTDVSFLRGD
jgi:molecular chaperone DnaK (HSP70)